MSEGDSFLLRTISDLSLLLRDPSSNPVQAAEHTVRSFCTKELRGVQGGVSDVEEYIANATLDLIIMSVWNLVAAQLDVERLAVRQICRYYWLIPCRHTRLLVIYEHGRCSKRRGSNTKQSSASSMREIGASYRKSLISEGIRERAFKAGSRMSERASTVGLDTTHAMIWTLYVPLNIIPTPQPLTNC